MIRLFAILLFVVAHTAVAHIPRSMRGLDMSGSVQGVGGVGGVLAVTMGPAAPRSAGTTHFASCDGNGNVVALTDAATGETTARYEYGPFGEIIRATGLMADLMPLRLSTMYADDVTGDIKFLFRDYRPGDGKWTSADPIGEYGGLNLYGFVCNDPLGYVDNCGLSLWTFLVGMQKCSFTLCYSIGLGEGLWAGTKGTAEALYGLGWYGNPITGLRHIYQDRQKLYQIARGLALLAELVEDGEFDRLLKTTAPNIHKLLHTDPGSPEFCKAYGQVGGQVLLEAVVAVATAGAGTEAKAASKAASEAADLSRTLNKAAKTGQNLLNPGINVTERGMQHVLERHIVNGIPEFAGKSKFTTGVNLEGLIQQGTQMPMVRHANGNFARTFDAGRAIGIDRATGQASSTVTIITAPNGNLVTMFPGVP